MNQIKHPTQNRGRYWKAIKLLELVDIAGNFKASPSPFTYSLYYLNLVRRTKQNILILFIHKSLFN